jgi:N-acetylmuramoyl-L-alanine amidase
MIPQMKNINLLKLLVILNIAIVPLLTFSAKKDYAAYADTASSRVIVTVDTLNVRSGADISSKIIGEVHQGDVFDTTRAKNGWEQIKLSNSQTGWVYQAYVAPAEKISATVEAIVLNVRNSPNLFSTVTGKLSLGDKITVLAEQAGWAKIVSSSGLKGWVYENFITKDTNNSTQSIAAVAPTSKTNRTGNKTDSTQTSIQSTGPSVTSSKQPLKGKTIVLDPGHGGIDDGTTSITGTHEKTLTLATAIAVEQKLKKAGANVIMTRTNDTYIPLQQRADLSNQNHADAFISFHYNWSNDPAANGLEDFYYQKSRDNTLASDILNEVTKTTRLRTLGTTFDDLDVLRNNTQPSTLIELGFLSNKQENSNVENSSFRNHVAQGVYLGLLDYFSTKS